MKSIKQQYIDLQEGRMSQANFMRNLRMSLPQYITNVTSFNDSVRILKNKGILTENYTPKELAMGVEVELEHTKNTETAAKIAMDHLRENPKYYSELAASGIEKPSMMQKIKNKIKSFTDPGKDPYGMGYDTMSGVFEGEEKNTAAEELAKTMGDYESAVIALQDEMGLSSQEANDIASKIYPEEEISEGLLNEAQDSEGKWKTVNGKDLYAQFKEIDNLNGQEVLIGIDAEMEKNHELTKLEAAKIVIKNLKKIPNYYTMAYLAGKEGAEPQYDKGIKPQDWQMKEVGKDNLVDKALGMKPVKDVEKVKASANKAKKETIKPEKGISLMSLVAKTVRGVQKMDATGEKMKKISTK